MPKLNRVLISSIMYQVEELAFLSREISSWLVDKVNLSRNFSATLPINDDTSKTLKNYRGTAGEMYILLLELAHERINFVLLLMIEFVEHHIGFETFRNDDEKKFTGPVHLETRNRLASTVKLLWSRMKAWTEFNEITSRALIKRVAYVDEYRIAIETRLATMTESKIALEKTIFKLQEKRIDRRSKENYDSKQQQQHSTKSTQTVNINEAIAEKNGTTIKKCGLIITPDDDPVTDMTREILSNKEKIDDLLRQNERISRALIRISRHKNKTETPAVLTN